MKTAAYSLIEVLIAGAVLAIGIAAAALLANSMLIQEEANTDLTRALNVQERVAKLYHLGLATNAITNVLPETFGSSTAGLDKFVLTFSAATTNNGVESVTSNLTFSVGSQSSDGSVVYRSSTTTNSRETTR